MFVSRTLTEHIARGVIGVVLLVVGLALAGQSALWLLLIVGSVVLWRGCISCWSIGLMAMLAGREGCADACEPRRG